MKFLKAFHGKMNFLFVLSVVGNTVVSFASENSKTVHMTTIEDVIRIAVNAHEGQKDMVGNPAITHVLVVGLMGKNECEQKAGFLHDVVEDTDLSIADLRARGVEEDVLTAVDLLTHRMGCL